jgi:TonB family protein
MSHKLNWGLSLAAGLLGEFLSLVFLILITAALLQAQGDPVGQRAHAIGYPTCSFCPSPQYTDEALKMNFRGTVLLRVNVRPDGRATHIEVVKDPGFGLAAKAIEAVKTWLFKPATGPDGTPVGTATPIEVTFQPPNKQAAPR